MALYLSERLNNNLYYTLEKSVFSYRNYISFCPPFFCQSEEKFVKCRHEREEGKFSDSQIFHFDKRTSVWIIIIIIIITIIIIIIPS